MKNWILITVVIVVLLVLYWAYKKYIYFPHAQVMSWDQTGIVWTNGANVIQAKINPNCVGDVGGSYGSRHEYQVQCLPNKQFRFFVHKMGQPNAIVVDNIYSFTSPPLYLTK